MYSYHHNPILDPFTLSKKISVTISCSFSVTVCFYQQSQTTSSGLCNSVDLSFQVYPYSGIRQYVGSSLCIPTLGIMFLGFFRIVTYIAVHSFLLLNSKITFCLSPHQLMGMGLFLYFSISLYFSVFLRLLGIILL